MHNGRGFGALGVSLDVSRHERFMFLFFHLFMSLVLFVAVLLCQRKNHLQFKSVSLVFRRKPIDGAPEPCEIVDFVRARLQEKQPLEASFFRQRLKQ